MCETYTSAVSTYTPMEMEIIRRLAAELVEAAIPMRALRIFGSRARGHSDEQSDLDIAVELGVPPDAVLSRRVMDMGRALSIPPVVNTLDLRVQIVPFFVGEDRSPLARAIAVEAETVWTRT
jgi:predicted nucleotidyltransferase